MFFIEIFLTVLEIITSIVFVSAFLAFKKDNKIKIFITCLIVAIIGMIFTKITIHSFINLFTSIISLLWIACVAFEGSFTSKMMITALYNSLSIIIELVVGVIVFNITDYEGILEGEAFNIQFITVLILFVKFLFVIWLKLTRNCKKAIDNNKFYILQSIIPIFSVIFLVTFIAIEKDITDFTNFYILIIMLVIINIMQYIIYGRVENMYIDKYQNTMLEQRNTHLSEYIRIVENNIERIKMMKHDMKNNLLLLQGIMKDDPNKAMEEIEKMVADTIYEGVQFFTADSGINAILNIKYNKAIKEGIDTKYDINIIGSMKFIESRDISSIIGNLLDNAIESCEKSDNNKYIDFGMYLHKRTLVIKMENSTDGKSTDLTTRKKNKEWHGLGMKVIDLLVNKYHGNYAWKFHNDSFKIEITLWDNK